MTWGKSGAWAIFIAAGLGGVGSTFAFLVFLVSVIIHRHQRLKSAREAAAPEAF